MDMHKFGTKTNAVSFNQTLARNAGKNKKRTKKTGASPFSKNQFLESFITFKKIMQESYDRVFMDPCFVLRIPGYEVKI